MSWVEGFYSRTGAWWSRAEARITERDHRRVALLDEYAGSGPKRVLELGSGYGTCTAVDTWWEAGDPDHPISQALRCYTPADLALLLLDTGLRLDTIRVGDEPAPPTPRPSWRELLRDHHEYLAVLHRDTAPQPYLLEGPQTRSTEQPPDPRGQP